MGSIKVLTDEELKKLIKQAEDAVSATQDENLKRIAFETILSKSLEMAGGKSFRTAGNASSRKATNKSTGGAKNKSTKVKKENKISKIGLDEATLKQLKSFYEEHKPNSQETTTFTLAYFISEKLNIQKFHEADIDYVYNCLLSLRPAHTPVAMSTEEIVRSMRWLVAKSRKKMWLKDDIEGLYSVSPQGKIYMMDKNNGEGKE